jgi:hypothetical protein
MNKWKLATAAGAALLIAGGGAALAAKELSSPSDESQAVINDAAKRLNVTPGALSDALKKALEDRIDAAVAAGRITKAEGDELKQRIESSGFPLFFRHPGFGAHFGGPLLFGGLDAAATYLGVTPDALRNDLESGKTLAQIAKDKGKSVDGLVQALYNGAKQRLDAAVSSGRLTQSQEDEILGRLKQHIADLVNGVRPGFVGPPQGFRRDGDF